MKIRITLFVLLALLLTACSKGYEPAPRHEPKVYHPVKPYNLNNEAVLKAGLNKTWNAALQYISTQPFTITIVDKSSKLITLEFTTPTPKEYFDCGYMEITGLRGQREMLKIPRNPRPKVDDYLNSMLRINLNILFKELDKNHTQATVNGTFNYSYSSVSYDIDVIYVTETKFITELQRIGDDYIKVAIPRTVTEPKVISKAKDITIEYKGMTTHQEGEQCQSTQQLEQMILQGIAAELEAGGK